MELWKQEKTPDALVELGSAALAAVACSLSQLRGPEFLERDNKVYIKKENKRKKEKEKEKNGH